MSRVLFRWLVTVNAVSAFLVAFDKVRARHGGRRVPERVLLLFGALGGAPLMLAAMLLCHHKTRKPKFMLTLPLFLLLWAAGVYLFAVYF